MLRHDLWLFYTFLDKDHKMYNWSCFHPTKFILMKIHKYTNILKVISLNYNPYNSCNHCFVHLQHVCLHLFKLTIHKLGDIIFVMNFMLNHWQFLIDVAPLHIIRTQCVCQWLKHILPLLSPLSNSWVFLGTLLKMNTNLNTSNLLVFSDK